MTQRNSLPIQDNKSLNKVEIIRKKKKLHKLSHLKGHSAAFRFSVIWSFAQFLWNKNKF